MQQIIGIFIEISLFRKGPQHLPNSTVLNTLSILGLAAVIAFGFGLQGEMMMGIAWAGIGPFLLSVSTILVLRYFGYPERVLRTVTAFAGTSVLISLLILPLDYALLAQVNNEVELSGILVLSWMAIFFWGLLVDAYIWSQALSAGMSVGLLCTALMFIVSRTVYNMVSLALQ